MLNHREHGAARDRITPAQCRDRFWRDLELAVLLDIRAIKGRVLDALGEIFREPNLVPASQEPASACPLQ
jgi:hypothetical protein